MYENCEINNFPAEPLECKLPDETTVHQQLSQDKN